VSQYILLNASKTFTGPFSDAPTAGAGQAVVTLTDQQYADWNALTRPDPQNRIVLFDPSFRYGSLDESSVVAPTLRAALLYVFWKVSDMNKMAAISATMSQMNYLFARSDDNGGSIQAAIKQVLQSSDFQSDATLVALQTQALALPQWTV
jgi:hypothetical protein